MHTDSHEFQHDNTSARQRAFLARHKHTLDEYDFSFELDADAPQLKNSKPPASADALDRNIVASVIGHSGYKVTIKHVSYGTYGRTPACLLALNVAFTWRNTQRDRFKSATIELSLHNVDPTTGAT